MMNRKRTLAMLLSLLLLSSGLVSCAEGTTEETSNGDAAGTTNVEAVPGESEDLEAETDPFIADALPDTLDYGDDDVTILTWNTYDPSEFMVEEDTGEIVDSAVFYRNLTVEERLKVKLGYNQVMTRGWDGKFMNEVQKSVNAGDFSLDLVAGYAGDAASCAVGGLLMDINALQYTDLTKPWYYKSATDAGTIGEKVYLTAGDLSYSALARMSGVFFNVDMLNDYQLEDPYELVLENVWTLDKMQEMINGIWTDENGNGKKDAADVFGMLIAHDQLQTTYYSAGNTWIELDANRMPALSEDVNSERVTALIDKWIAIFEGDVWKGNVDVTDVFDQGRSLFYVYPLGHVATGLRNTELNYGFVPQPKFDENQENYIASVTNAVTMWGIPLVVQDEDQVGALMECLASEGYRRITPAVFEQAYKAKYNFDESGRQTQIFDMLRANVHFDLGKIFSTSLFSGVPNSSYADCIWNGANTYTSKMAANKRVISRAITKLVQDLGGEEVE